MGPQRQPVRGPGGDNVHRHGGHAREEEEGRQAGNHHGCSWMRYLDRRRLTEHGFFIGEPRESNRLRHKFR